MTPKQGLVFTCKAFINQTVITQKKEAHHDRYKLYNIGRMAEIS